MFYHRECHDPPVDEKVMLERQNDPRFIWQCKQCLSMISRISTKKRSESQQKEKNPASEPFKRQDKLQTIKSGLIIGKSGFLKIQIKICLVVVVRLIKKVLKKHAQEIISKT